MSEDDARDWLAARVSRETVAFLERLVAILIAEAAQQNLVSASSIDHIWARHIVDSAQLIDLAPVDGTWMDLGSGAGFPGLAIALLTTRRVVLTEARARRVTFLRDAVVALGLGKRVEVAAGRIEMLPPSRHAVISARAFAPLDRLFATSRHLADMSTTWVLPKGRGAQAELDAARGSWQGDFRVVQSVTDPDAAIIVAQNVRPKDGGRKAGNGR